MSHGPRAPHRSPFNVIAVVAALGYFVDIYDLILFGIVRRASLIELGYSGDALLTEGAALLNWQMAGTLVGGILWGVLGDLRGRLSVLFGSIILYSLANLANGWVTDVDQYAVLRFVAGIGLAGELGAGITLVNETMDKEARGWGTTMVASFGVLGAVLAFWVGESFDWRTAYFVGGGLGLALLVLRFGTYESGMFKSLDKKKVELARFDLLFLRPRRLLKYLACIGVGIPIWFSIGILIFFADAFGKTLGVDGAIAPGKAIMWAYIGLAAGDLSSGWMSQIIRSRKKAIFAFLGLLIAVDATYLLVHGHSPAMFYTLCALVGFAAGYWALFVTMASEQFGTNIRATVTTTAPNFVRGAVVPITTGWQALSAGALGLVGGTAVVGVICFGLALLSLGYLEETFGKDLDHLEES
ncbi:MAG: MFS transporter [Deltaproteobacteria bacterium]|nr:MFS transporter [Deltaproteobacteria bacterium]